MIPKSAVTVPDVSAMVKVSSPSVCAIDNLLLAYVAVKLSLALIKVFKSSQVSSASVVKLISVVSSSVIVKVPAPTKSVEVAVLVLVL